MDSWYKIITPSREVREELSFNPDEFAIALEQVIAGAAPDDYRKVKGRDCKKSRASSTGEITGTRREATTLDRVHAAMLLQRGGQSNALRALLNAEQDRGPEFLRLANVLSALYPRESEEKRLLDAMLLAVPR